MGITFDKDSGIFHLRAGNTSYVIKLTKQGDIVHLYWGRKIRDADISYMLRPTYRIFSPNSHSGDIEMSFDTLPLEYPFYGTGDFRSPAFRVQLGSGYTISELKYLSHCLSRGKQPLEGLPATYVEDENEAESLCIEMYDPIIKLKVTLNYTAFNSFDAITRSVKFTNLGNEDIRLLRALSFNTDFNDCNFRMLQLSGSWARERYIHTRQLVPGCQSIESKRGASSHQHNPFFALMGNDATEDHGDVYGFSLVYSGSFLAAVEVDQFNTTRVSMGINPFNFSWVIEPEKTFQTPEAVLVYSHEGLGQMSRTYHKLYRTRLCRGKFRDRQRPILINNWEATYFDFNEEGLERIARAARDLGIELFVLDDGWFGKRNSDETSLGDWVVNRDKLPGGLEGLGEKIRSMGMEFGIWVEPEMVSPDSYLYRKHPDWCINVPGRRRTESRSQIVLDLSRDDVCDAIIMMLKGVLSSAPISYVKWDMNRNMTEIGSAGLPPGRQEETSHRYMLGLYRILEEITSAFPDVLFESCSGGGGRFDPGMLYYMPQTWTSDNTDAINRLMIQYGTSMAYPAITMGSHVSAIPNHQTHRITPLMTRVHTAMSGNLGLELDITKLNPEERGFIKEQIRLYKEIRPLVQEGLMYRLLSPFDGNMTAWMFVSEDKSEAAIFYFKILAEAHEPLRILRLKGLDPDRDYCLLGFDEIFTGDALMNAGFKVPVLIGAFQSSLFRLVTVE